VLLVCSGALARCALLGPGDERCHLGHEVLEVSEGLEPVEDYLVIDPDVVMDQDVPEADRLADGASEAWSADAVLAEQPDGVAVVRRRSPPFRCADVLGDVHPSIAVTNVYLTPRSQMGSSRRLPLAADSRFSTEMSSVMLRSSRRTRSSSTTGYPCLAVTAAANSRWARVIRGSSSE
jgi:hypothetical protein